jgi:8-oxo-dGTP diphosphatase
MGAAGLLCRDVNDRVLLLKPHYRPTWQLPGGLLETDESPRLGAQREVAEEIALTVPVGRLLVVDYKSATAERPACLQFVFDGSVLTAEQLDRIQLEAEEIAEWRLTEPDDALSLVEPGGPAGRLAAALHCLDTDTAVYLEDGQPA